MGNIPKRDPLSRDRGGRPLPQRGVRPEKLQEGQTDADKAKGIPFADDFPDSVDGDRLEVRGGKIVARPPEHGGGDAAPPHLSGTPHEHDILSAEHPDTYADDTEEHLDVMTWIASDAFAAGVAMIHNAGGATTWDISIMDGDDGEWTNVELPATLTSERPQAFCLTRDLWFVAAVGGLPDPTQQTSLNECNRELLRSTDGGLTWAATVVGDETCTTERAETGDEVNHFSRVARAVSGRVWAARKLGTDSGDPVRSEVYYSDADGETLTWTLSTTLTDSACPYPVMLLCHPTDPNIVVLISTYSSGTDDRVVIHYTTDAGDNWTTNDPTVASGDNFAVTDRGAAFRALLLPTGRLVIANRDGTSDHAKIYTSDDYGLTWDLRWTDTSTDEDNMVLFTQGQWRSEGQHLIGVRAPEDTDTDWAIVSSVDSGTTWTERPLTAPSPTNGDIDAVYDPANDRLMVQIGNETTAANRVLALANASTIGNTWEDITGDLPDEASNNMNWNGLAAIPLETAGGRWEARPADDHGTHGGGGGGSGDVATDTIWDAKGDLAAGTGADTASKLTVGADDTILMADSAQTTGLKWVASATPSTQAFGDAAAVGTADTFTRGDHKHAMPANPVTAHAAAADPHTGYVLESLLDAKGDLIAASADNTPAKLTVGADDTILMADAAAEPGLKWVAPGTPGAIDASGGAGTADTYARGDHTHAHEAAHIAHDTIFAAAGDLIQGTANDTGAVLSAGLVGQFLRGAGAATVNAWVNPEIRGYLTDMSDGSAKGQMRFNRATGTMFTTLAITSLVATVVQTHVFTFRKNGTSLGTVSLGSASRATSTVSAFGFAAGDLLTVDHDADSGGHSTDEGGEMEWSIY